MNTLLKWIEWEEDMGWHGMESPFLFVNLTNKQLGVVYGIYYGFQEEP